MEKRGKETKDLVKENAIHIETIKKERRHQKVFTEFSLNPRKKREYLVFGFDTSGTTLLTVLTPFTVHVLPDKPMSRDPPEVTEDADFIRAFHKAREEPTKKYHLPQTETQEIGWFSTPLTTVDRSDQRLHFQRLGTDVTKHQELALRKGAQ